MDPSTEPLLDEEEKEVEEGPVVGEEWYKGRKWLTVEPCLLLYFMAFMPLFPLQDQFVLDALKLRRNISVDGNFSQCTLNMSDPADVAQTEVAGEAAMWMTVLTAVTFAPSIVTTTLLGSYSDKRGRKIALIPPLLGASARILLTIFLIVFRLPLELLILAAFLEGCSGGVATFLMGAFSSLADVTTRKQRSLRVFLLDFAIGIGTFISQIATGYVIKLLGYMYPFIILGSVHVINIIYTLTLLPETRRKEEGVRFFTTEHIKKTWWLYTRDDDTKRRWKLQLTLFLLLIGCMVDLGGGDALNYYLLAPPLCFTSVLLGYFQALLYLIRNVCGLLAVKLFITRVGDVLFMLLSNVSGILFLSLVAVSNTITMAFIAPVGSILYMLLIPMVRSFISKLVSSDEQGVAFSAIGMTQGLAILLGSAAFNYIFSATLPTFKPTVLIVEIAVLFLGILITILLYVRMKRERSICMVNVITVPEHD